MAVKYGTRVVIQTQGARGVTNLVKHETWGDGHAKAASAYLTEYTKKSADPVVHHYFEPISYDESVLVR